MQYETMYVTAAGLRILLADLAAALGGNEVASPIRVYPAAEPHQLKVELTDYEYARLLRKDLQLRYNPPL
jgi:hypothetical protein